MLFARCVRARNAVEGSLFDVTVGTACNPREVLRRISRARLTVDPGALFGGPALRTKEKPRATPLRMTAYLRRLIVSVKKVRLRLRPEFVPGVAGHAARKTFGRAHQGMFNVRLAIRPPRI